MTNTLHPNYKYIVTQPIPPALMGLFRDESEQWQIQKKYMTNTLQLNDKYIVTQPNQPALMGLFRDESEQ